MTWNINVNGTLRYVDVDGDTPLLWVLRDVLGMTGTKFGCGLGLCGACTVHIDGMAQRSCITRIDSIKAHRGNLNWHDPNPALRERPKTPGACRGTDRGRTACVLGSL